MTTTKRPRPPRPEYETVQELWEDEISAWRKMGDLLKEGKRRACYRLYRESFERVQIRREQLRRGRLEEIQIRQIRRRLDQPEARAA